MPIDAEVSPAALKASFLRWLEHAKDTLTIQIVIHEVTADSISFGFEGCTPVLRGWVADRGGNNSAEMLIDANYNGVWDGLWWPDSVQPVRRPSGWVCATCENEGHPVLFESAEAIWRDHLFDPLLKWVNETLAPAAYIAFSDDNGMQCVNLLQQAEHGAKYIIPIREGQQ